MFQLFALKETPEILQDPGRGEFVKAIAGRVLAAGMLVGTYSRDEPVAAPRDEPAATQLGGGLRPASA